MSNHNDNHPIATCPANLIAEGLEQAFSFPVPPMVKKKDRGTSDVIQSTLTSELFKPLLKFWQERHGTYKLNW
jgi:hypothetical protein